jgi:hypothetical protein
MNSPDTLKLAVALVLTFATAWLAMSEGMKGSAPRPRRARRRRPARALSGAASAYGAVLAPPMGAAESGRLRILTGEPTGVAEPPRNARSGTTRLAGGIAMLATAGAVGLLAVALALILMVRRIGG